MLAGFEQHPASRIMEHFKCQNIVGVVVSCTELAALPERFLKRSQMTVPRGIFPEEVILTAFLWYIIYIYIYKQNSTLLKVMKGDES